MSGSASTDFGGGVASSSPEVCAAAEEEMTTMESSSPTPSDVRVKFFGGINIGACHSTVCSAGVGGSSVIDLEPNDLSGRSTPSTISFCDSLRLIGDVAEDQLILSPETTFPILPLLLLLEVNHHSSSSEAEDLFKRFSPILPTATPFRRMAEGDQQTLIHVKFADREYSLSPSQLMAHYLRRLAGFAAEGRRHKQQEHSDVLEVAAGQFCVALPDTVMVQGGDRVGKAISKASRTGALNADTAYYCGQMTAIIACWITKHLINTYADFRAKSAEESSSGSPLPPLYVAFFNCGFSESSFALLEAKPRADIKSEKLEVENFELNIKQREVIDLGVYDILKTFTFLLEQKAIQKDSSIGKPFTTAVESGGEGAAPLSKRQRRFGARMLATAQKVMKELGGLNIAVFNANLGNEDGDCNFEVRRDEFEMCLQHTILTKLTGWLQKCVETANSVIQSNGIYLGCEVVGGGSRIPIIADTLSRCLQSQPMLNSKLLLRRTLDGTAAAAIGCTALAAGLVNNRSLEGVFKIPSSQNTWSNDDERRTFMTTEKQMRDIEDAEHKRLDAQNKLEAKIMELEGLVRQNIEGSDKLQTHITQVKDWFYSASDDIVTTERYLEEYRKLDQQAHTHCQAYFDHLEAERVAQDQKLEENAARLEAENAGKEKDDHDNRHLPNSQRLQLARKNKDEGNELLKGGSLALAIQRYLKAIGHLSKMFDCSPQETEERNTLMLACHLNMAQTYLKEGSAAAAQKAVQSCTSALELDPENHKGLFRRGQAYERLRDLDMAKKDLAKVIASQSPADPAVVKCMERVDRAIKAEDEKAKRMYGKMFG